MSDVVQSLHNDLLQKYLERANFDYGQIEDDSYIFGNMGHHLAQSGRFDLFPEIFLSLQYVEACLKSSSYSSVDLLQDFSRYGDYIEGKVSLNYSANVINYGLIF